MHIWNRRTTGATRVRTRTTSSSRGRRGSRGRRRPGRCVPGPPRSRRTIGCDATTRPTSLLLVDVSGDNAGRSQQGRDSSGGEGGPYTHRRETRTAASFFIPTRRRPWPQFDGRGKSTVAPPSVSQYHQHHRRPPTPRHKTFRAGTPWVPTEEDTAARSKCNHTFISATTVVDSVRWSLQLCTSPHHFHWVAFGDGRSTCMLCSPPCASHINWNAFSTEHSITGND